ncbi:DNA cytosine methyltransferase [Tychonema sp. BBK16]|uniref:DNA cytosine methyltransferase n=1 Tax=Tychonema sp. BBK16 TaxID=2699888 RepID=UPI001F3A069A|nr:DNA cytosine methyltransferase [Tychonema sp. BBK16]MCF6373290.1 DNA cytosine methyltransferase [Tychonema sp. BBK16]
MPSSRKKRPIAVDLFAGAGGMTLGFEQAGFDVLASVEIDPIHCATHEFNFPRCSILCKDIALLTGKEIRKNSQIGKRQIDVVISGSPCQGFSLMGKRDIDDPRNSLIFHFQRLVLELKPKFFVMENVPGIKAGEHKELLDFLISSFIEAGYQVEENYQVLNAAHYGVPQSRKRLFLIGCKADCQLPKYPLPTTLLPKMNAKVNVPKRKVKPKINPDLPVVPTVLDAIGDLPEIEKYSELLDRDWVTAEYGKSSSYASIMRGINHFDDDYSYDRKYDRQILSSSLRTNHSPECIERFAAAKHGERDPISRFYKLHPDGVCNTLRAGTDRARGAYTSPRPIHPIAPRCITVREAARLHSYPDWFRFHSTKWHGFRQVGNSVPPLLAKVVASEIIRALGIEPIKPRLKLTLGDELLLKMNWSEANQYYKK